MAENLNHTVPAPSAESVKNLFARHVVPSYGRYDIVLDHGKGVRVWDAGGRCYLDFSGGIAVNALGHAHPELVEAIAAQAGRLMHVSNLYYSAPQGLLAELLAGQAGDGKLFFCNSGAEANEGLLKLARRFGHDEGRFEVLTTVNSFHGRTLAGIAATGQDKVKKGFEPMPEGFRHVPFNDLAAMRAAVSPGTAAILVEGVQGEGGITPAAPEYLLGLRALCDEKNLLLLMDGVQCGHFRTGRFQSFQRILEGVPGGETFLPDGISMAKSLGGGFPIGAFWVRWPYADLLSAGTHGSTYGGNPLACAAALKVAQIILRDKLPDNARSCGAFLKEGIQTLAAQHPHIVKGARGLGLLLGVELASGIPAFAGSDKSPAAQFIALLHEAGMLAVPAGTHVVRLLPPLNVSRAEAEEGLALLAAVIRKIV